LTLKQVTLQQVTLKTEQTTKNNDPQPNQYRQPQRMTTLLDLPLTQSATDKIHWGNLTGSALSLAVCHGAKHHDGAILLVVPDTPAAFKLELELAFFKRPDNYEVLVFPDWETLPYDTFSPHQDIISQRLLTLHQLLSLKKGIIIVPINTLMLRLAPKSFLRLNSLVIDKFQALNLHKLRQQLDLSGYRAVEQVMEHGEFSVRGSILDLYPMGSNSPYRLDFFDDEVDSIRLFDPETQRSSELIDKIRLLPAHEFSTGKESVELFRKNYRDKFKVIPDKGSIYQQVSKNVLPSGIEYYLPLFFDHTSDLFEFLPDNTLLMTSGDLEESAKRYWGDIEHRYEERRYDQMRPLLEPHALFLPVEELFARFKTLPRIQLHLAKMRKKAGVSNLDTQPLGDIAVNHQIKAPLSPLVDFIVKQKLKKGRILFSVESPGRRETLLELLKKVNLTPTFFANLPEFINGSDDLGVVIGAAESSFILKTDEHLLTFITETELLGNRVTQRRRRKHQQATSAESIFRNLAELSIGQPVVHIDHGIGRYQGLQIIDAGGMETEFLTLEYANEAKLYVPVASLHLISRYSGGESDKAPLHKLGSDAWDRAKRRATEKVRDVAAELLEVYAQRAAKQGFKYRTDEQDYASFAGSFPFEETIDQQEAISAVLNDMQSTNAMDRLICGDVGFGKTEVAMRAAFVAIEGGKQVAILVPTTLLAQQHFENFKDRFANWPFKVDVLSRFRSAKEQKEVLAELASGQLDLVIGTHKLLNQEIKYQDLGLLVIDEEHRFGVRQKEKIKKMRSNVDILTLTATPIPRTLNMAMSGMRDLSIIATPPAKRLAIKTFVHEHNDTIVREAIMREIMRGGQVYFLHNEVATIARIAEDISKLVPEARITVAHGQMRERELESIMRDFYHQRFNLLVCTTIIETGIDVPTANTIIMNRADNLGLAQLHQLRGRVGRSHHQAYAYLLTPHPKRMTKDAIKRLEAISSLEALGAGFALATQDLEIRGAGELLGDEQSGQIASIGFTLYMDMLEEAVESLRSGKEPSLDRLLAQQTSIDLKLSALFPEEFIRDVNMRLSMYKRVASCRDIDALDDIQIELIDRFGLLPDPAKHLFKVSEFKLAAAALGIKKIEAGPKGGYIEFSERTTVDPRFIISLIQQQSRIYKMEGANRLRFALGSEDGKSRIKLIGQLLNDFKHKTAA
jgi:transcription-repair coupling factor (superfamily II helicase)